MACKFAKIDHQKIGTGEPLNHGRTYLVVKCANAKNVLFGDLSPIILNELVCKICPYNTKK